MNWIKNGLAGWAIMSSIWGLASIIYDITLECMFGRDATISWQTQLKSISNPVIPTACGLVIGGLTVHFFVVRSLHWNDAHQPWKFWLCGAVAGGLLVLASWTQRP